MKEINLLIPGPMPLPPEVRAAMSAPMINHRGEDFSRMLGTVLRGLQTVFQVSGPVLPIVASGTGGLEAAIVNVLSPGDRVLALSCGLFGDRFAMIAEAFGANVIKVEADWGRTIDPALVTDALRQHRGVKAVLLTHNETSTGVTNPLQAIAEAVRSTDALLVVDAVSSAGAIDIRADAWGLDVVVTGSQKALMGPPGMAFVSVSPRAWEAIKTSRMPKHYFSFEHARTQLTAAGPFTPFTPALPVIYALEVSIAMILREGLAARFAHHQHLARATRTGVKALGLELFPHLSGASDTVTAVRMPEGLDVKDLLRRLRTDHHVILAGGQGRLDGKIVRIGHMGYVQNQQIMAALEALEHVLPHFGHPVRPGTAAGAAAAILKAP